MNVRLLSLLIVSLSFSTSGSLAQSPTPSLSPKLVTATCGKPVCTWNAFGPGIYTRQTGKPQATTSAFSVLNVNTQYTLHIDNNGVASAVVSINGTQVFGPSDFDPYVTTLNRAVTLATNNTVTVELRSKPGTSLAVTVIGVDSDPPSIAELAAPPPNAFGWNNTNVGVSFKCSDATSGIAACPSPFVLTTEGLNQVASGTAFDRAGNSATSSIQISIDKTPPTIAASQAPPANSFNWNNTLVTVSFACADNLSGVQTCNAPVTVSTEGARQSVSGSATDFAGNTASTATSVNIDLTPPTITASALPAPNAAGWNNSAVTVSFSCADALSGVASCPSPVSVSSEGANQPVSGTAFDKAGNRGVARLNLNIDRTPPTIAASALPGPNAAGWNSSAVTVSFSCADALSGVASCPSPVSVSLEGANQPVSGTAFDKAGNSGVASLNLNIDLTPPVLAVTSPADGSIVTASTISVGGTVSDALSGVSSVQCNGVSASVSSGTFLCQIVLKPGANTLQITATDVAGNQVSSSRTVTFQTAPVITALNPTTGAPGSQVTITGTNFGVTKGTSTVSFNGVAATTTSWSDTAISVNVPSGAISGNVVVTVAGQSSNVVAFAVLTGSLSGSYGPTPTAVTLTSPIAIDWAHWGTSSDAPLVRSTETLSDFTVIGAHAPVQFSDGEIEYIWTDGDVLPTANRVTTGVLVTGTGNGFHLSVPADTTPKTLTLYVGAFEAQGRLTVSLSDKSAASLTDSSVDIVPSNRDHHVNGAYTLSFQAGQPGQSLNIDYVLAVDHGSATGVAGNVTLQSAVLTAQQPSVALTSPSDGQVFTFPASIPLAATATQNGAGIASVAFISDSQTVFTLTSPPYSATLSGLLAGNHMLAATVIDTNGLSSTSAPILISEVGSGGVLTASATNINGLSSTPAPVTMSSASSRSPLPAFLAAPATPVSVVLSAGSSDWVHWGNSVPDRKAGIAPQISNFTTLANGSSHSYDASALNGVNYSWSSGTPTDSQTGTATQMRMQGYQNGFSLTIAADTTARTLKLYVASGFGESTLRASLSDGSAAPVVSTTATATAFAEKVYTIQFQTASAGQTLTVTDQVTRDDGFAYVALESASVSDQNPPHIDSVSPITAAPGAQVSILGSNFGASQTTARLAFGGVTMNVVSWSDSSITATVPLSPSGALVVSRGLANSNGVPFAVVLPPPPAIASISPTAGSEGTTVTIIGSHFGAAQNNSTVTFNGASAIQASWSDTQITVPAPIGVHTGQVVVTTVSGPSNGVVFTFSPGIRFSVQSLYVTPDEASLEVGNSRSFNVVAASGNALTDVTWSVDTITLATISADATSSSSATLQGLAPGEVTITATSASLGAAKAKATIYAAGALPAGTPAWSFFPQTQSNFGSPFFGTVKARRNSADDPFLYFAESGHSQSGAPQSTIHAVDGSGSLKWRVTLSPTDPANGEADGMIAMGTNDGGLLVQTTECCNSFPFVFTHLGPDGKQAWNYTTLAFPHNPAIGPDGTIYFWSIGNVGANIPTAFVGLDDATGTEKFRRLPGINTSYNFVSAEPSGSTPCAQRPNAVLPSFPVTPSHVSDPIVGTDGNAYVMAIGSDLKYTYTTCNVSITTDPFTNQPVYTVTLLDGNLTFNQSVALIRVTPTGDTVNIPVGTVSYSGEARWADSWSYNNGNAQFPRLSFDRIAPDGQGGTLMTWNQQTSALGDVPRGFLSRVADGGVSYTLSDGAVGTTDIFAGPPTAGEIASNDQGTAFFDLFDFSSLSHKITAVDVMSGATKWTSNAGSINAATDNGGVLVKTALGIQAIDQNGVLGSNVLPTTGDSTYIDGGEFEANGPAGSRQLIDTSLAGVAESSSPGWFMLQVAAPAVQRQPEFRPVVADACSGYDDSLRPTALIVPFAANTPASSQRVVRLHYPDWQNIDLASSDPAVFTVSPDHLTGPNTDVTILATGLPEPATFTPDGNAITTPSRPRPLQFVNRVTHTQIGQVLVDVKQKKTFSVAPYAVSELNNRLKPTTAPTQSDLQTELSRIFPAQTGVTLTVPNAPSPISVHYDLNGSHALTFPDTKEKGNELAEIVKAVLANMAVNQLQVFYVHAFDQEPEGPHADGITLRGGVSEQTRDGNPGASGPTVVRDPAPSSVPGQNIIHNSRSNVTAHELGHYLGAPDVRDRTRRNELMFESADQEHPNPCRIRKSEWDVINPPGSRQ